jgi:hypothetical protein
MSLTDTVAGTVLGGFIAGIVGLLTTRYERSLRRKEAHMREHEKNFNVIQDSLLELKPQLWPIAKGAENFMLPRWKRPPYKQQLVNYSIVNYQRFEKLPGSGLDTVFRTITVDNVLYLDIPKHFRDIANQLAAIETCVHTKGVQLDELVYEVSDAIYKTMDSSDASVLHYTFDQGNKATLREIASKDSIESQGYAGFLFLLLVKEDPANWPMNYGGLEKYDMLDTLKKLVSEIKDGLGVKASEMLELKSQIFSQIDACNNALELQKHKSSLKGKCEYV